MKLFRRKSPAIPIRGIHLDFKGLPPTPKRLMEVLDLLAEARVNCVLAEWEDMYPWKRHPEVRCETAYPVTVVKRFLDRAAELGIEVIPLVQCFGHMEYMLKHKRFRAMREMADSPGEMCPSHSGAVGAVIDMIEDVLETHEGRISRFHLGGDEVWSLGACPKCKRAVAKHGKAALYMKQVSPLLDMLKGRGLAPILWDDMMRKWSVRDLRKLAPRAELMAWAYGADPFERLTPELFAKYAKAGVNVWGASAFRGADGKIANVPNVETRIADLNAWAGAAKRLGLVGLVATGWGRYGHVAAPCDGLEASLHTLVLAGASMWDGKLPPDAEAEAMRFLKTGRRKALAGERFVKCLETSRIIDRWRGQLAGLPDYTDHIAEFAGAPDRPSERESRQRLRSWTSYIRRGKKRSAEWVRAHSGLVPRVWLERYAESRFGQGLEIARFMEKKLSGIIKRRRK